MRLHEILSEKIQNTPHRLPVYVERRLADLTKIKAEMSRLQPAALAGLARIEASDDGRYIIDDTMRALTDGSVRDFDDVEYWLKPSWNDESRLEHALRLDDLIRNLQSYRQYGSQFLGYLVDNAKSENSLASIEPVLSPLTGFAAAATANGWSESSDYSMVEQIVTLLRQIGVAISRVSAIKADLAAKLGAVQDGAQAGDRYRPEHGATETLYHATAYAADIVRDGFAAEKPIERQGLGNFGTQKTISFTHSLEIAHTISRCLKEVWMISHGQLTARTLVGWIRKEGIDKDYPDVAKIIGLSIANGEPDPMFGQRHRIKTLDEIVRDNDPREALEVYSKYLWLTKLRSNPVFTGMDNLFDLMRDRQLSDIGVIACECAIGEKDEYLLGEKEFRLPMSAVRSIKRVF